MVIFLCTDASSFQGAPKPTSARSSAMIKLKHLLNQSPMNGAGEDANNTRSACGNTPIPKLFDPAVISQSDGLITPNSSQPSASFETDDHTLDEDPGHELRVHDILSEMSSKALTRIAVESKLSDIPWCNVEQALKKFEFTEQLTRSDVALIVRLWHTFSHVDVNMLARECFARKTEYLRFFPALIEAYYGIKRNLLLKEEDEFLALQRKIPAQFLPAALQEKEKQELAENNHLYDLIETDLTSNGLKTAINLKMSMLKVISLIEEEIERRGGSSQIPLTSPERDFIRSVLEEELSSEEIRWQLPFRTQEEIDKQIRVLQSACIRQERFKNGIERLLYEAEWYTSMTEITSTPGGRRRRVRKGSVEFDTLRKEALELKNPKIEKKTQETEIAKARATRASKRAAKIRQNKEARLLARKKLVAKRASALRRSLRFRKDRPALISSLIEEAKYFQSVTGDGKFVGEGDKRKRSPTYHLNSDYQNGQKLETAQNRIEERKRRRRGRPRLNRETPSTEESDYDDAHIFHRAMEEEDLSEDEKTSPFDPPDILRDINVPLHGRRLFNDSISAGSLFPDFTSFSPDIIAMMRPGPELPINNTVASMVIRENLKSYKSLSGSFPPLFVENEDGTTVSNPRNIIHIRYLLYPRHTEQFILAKPKSNELDPVFEINKVFQIHYALYFSHSEELKNVFYKDYCQKLQEALEEDDFVAFLKVIDRWNALMLELSPYPIEINPSIDINESLRCYLPPTYEMFPSFNDLKLPLFYLEVFAACEKLFSGQSIPKEKAAVERRLSQTLQSAQLSSKTPLSEEGAQLPDLYVSRFGHLRPIMYASAFIKLLNSITTITRYCVHQLLLRAYSRIVSPQSRKLRSYKAFSAEVYGELLPCFVSEVLKKVDLKPHHKFYDLGSGVGNTTFQAALEFGVHESGGCEIMEHASSLAFLQEIFLQKQLVVLGLKELNLSLALGQSFVNNEEVRKKCVDCDVLIVNNYLFDFKLNVAVGKLLYGLRPGSKIISLNNFIHPRYKAGEEKTIFDYLYVEKFEMGEYFSVSWTANKVPYYISTVQEEILDEYK